MTARRACSSRGPARMRSVARLALRGARALPLPAPVLAAAASTARARHIERFESSRSLNRRSIGAAGEDADLRRLHARRARARRRSAGSRAASWPRGDAARRAVRAPPCRVTPPAGESSSCDVVVVGSGAGGAAAARVLAEAGLDVVVVEEGEHHDARRLRTTRLDALRTLYRDGGLTACDGRPPIPLPVGRCVGGTTVINSGTACARPATCSCRWRDEHGIPWAAELERRVRGARARPAR